MKTKKISRKLVLNRSTVSNLNGLSMGRVQGGATQLGGPCIGPTGFNCTDVDCFTPDCTNTCGCTETCNTCECTVTCHTCGGANTCVNTCEYCLDPSIQYC
jgi:hypothetical protein